MSDSSTFIIPYDFLYEKVFAHVRPLYYILTILWVAFLFYAMYSIADRHFTWALEQLAVYLCLSPDIAGMTLLAFGNGAPDFFTAVFGAKEEPEMILGSSVGSGLFIVTIVFGAVVLMARRPGSDRTVILEEGSIVDPTAACHGQGKFFECVNVKHSVQPIPFIRGLFMYLLCVIALAILSLLKQIPFWLPLILLSIFFIYLGLTIALYFVGGAFRRPSRTPSVVLDDDPTVKARGQALDVFHRFPLSRRLLFATRSTCWDQAWAKGGAIRIWRVVSFMIKVPSNLVLNLTILPVEVPETIQTADGFTALRFFHRIRCIVNPFFSLLLYLYLLYPGELRRAPWYIWTIYGFLSSLLSLGLYFSTSWSKPPRFFLLHVLYSFCTCILWIYATSSELLSCLSSTGNFLNISPVVMGIIVLAWGNSFGDLVADLATARNGAFETAVTAIFSGPVQNVLLTLGTGFLIAALQSPKHQILVSALRFDIYFALGLILLVILSCLILVPFVFDFQIPRNFGFLLLLVYALYLPCAIIFGLDLIKF